MDLGAREVGEPARMIEVEVPEHDRVDVAWPDAQPRRAAAAAILVRHVGRSEREAARAVVASRAAPGPPSFR